MIRRNLLALLLILGLSTQSALARINHVPENFLTIQAAINATRDGDTVLVDPGRYQENLVFNGKDIVVGSFILTIGGDIWIRETIIDGNADGEVVRFEGEHAERSTLRGFTIRNGETALGAGIYVAQNTNVKLVDLLIIDNHANQKGGGIYIQKSTPQLTRVKIEQNDAAREGGGIYVFEAKPILIDCEITQNQANSGSGLYSESSDLDLQHVLIAGNISEERSSFHMWGGYLRGGDSFFDHVTIAGNEAGEGLSAGLILDTDTAEDIILSVKNSIFWNNSEDDIMLVDGENEWDGSAILNIEYSDLEMIQDSLHYPEGDTVIWGEGIIGDDPMFADAEEGDFRLDPISPCIDVGNPDDPEDPDGSRTDIGALGIWQEGMLVQGIILDSENDHVIPFATGLGIANNNIVFLIDCDNNGVWRFDFETAIHNLAFQVHARDYLSKSVEMELEEGHSSPIFTRLDHSEFTAARDTITATLDSGEFNQMAFRFRNTGNGPLTWHSTVRNSGESGSPSWTLRDRIRVTELTGDAGIQGVIFNGTNFCFAGANGLAESQIWVVNREGEIIDSIRQPGSSRLGFRDMEWDGDLIWGADEDSIFAIDLEGRVHHSWPGPEQTTTNIAYDPLEGVVWISGTTTNIEAYDRDGNALGRSVDHLGMRVYGLGWLPDAQDSMHFIVLQKPANGPTIITGLNPFNADTLNYNPVGIEENNSFGLYVSQNFDHFAGSVLMLMQNLPENRGGDLLDIIQFHPNSSWITTDPPFGEVPPDGESQIRLIVTTSSAADNWGLRGGVYRGDLAFVHDGVDGEFLLPLEITVIGTSGIKDEANLQPETASITALYPQPFNSTLNIEYQLPGASPIKVSLIDLGGREVMQKQFDRLEAGSHRMELSADQLGSGLYLLRIEGNFGNLSSKLVLLK